MSTMYRAWRQYVEVFETYKKRLAFLVRIENSTINHVRELPNPVERLRETKGKIRCYSIETYFSCSAAAKF